MRASAPDSRWGCTRSVTAGSSRCIRAWERVYRSLDSRERRHFRARRHRIEHFEMPSPAHVERAAMLGLAVSVQPVFDRLWGGPGGLYETRFGVGARGDDEPRSARCSSAGSRSAPARIRPSRRSTLARRAGAARITTQPASAYPGSRRSACTRSGARDSAHQEEKKGALGHGMHADFVVYDADPFEAPALDGARRRSSPSRSVVRSTPPNRCRSRVSFVTLSAARP